MDGADAMLSEKLLQVTIRSNSKMTQIIKAVEDLH
jgi:hypothetical protein